MTAIAFTETRPALPSPPVPLARALAELVAGLDPVPVRRTALAEAAGSVLASPLFVPAPVPAQSIALRRGYAVRATDTLGASPYSPLLLPAAPRLVEAGDLLPPGTDCVLPEDAVLLSPGPAEMQESAAPGLFARRVGEDAPAAAVLAQAGERLTSIGIAVAEATGLTECEVRRPRIVICGNRASPSVRLVGALARSFGAEVQVSDTSLSDMTAPADLAIMVGSMSAASEQVIAAGARVVAQRLALRPGEDCSALRLGTVPVLVASGRPADALGLCLALALPILRVLSGAVSPPSQPGRLSRKISSGIGVTDIVLLRRSGDALEPLGTGDLSLPAIAAAEFFLLVGPESEGVATGDLVLAETMPGR